MISFANLTYFVVVAEELSFSKAAKRLFVTQQNVSNTIRNMESEYNLRLFNRSVSGVSLTDAGECLYENARILLAQKEQMDRQLGDIRSQQTHALTIGAPVSFGLYLLPEIICRFKADNPKVDISIIHLRSDQIIDQLKNEKLEIAMGLNLYDPALISHRLYEENFYLLISRRLFEEYYTPAQRKSFLSRESVPISELSACSFIICDAMPWNNHFFNDGLSSACPEPDITIRTSNFLMMLELCGKGLGAAIIMESFRRMIMGKDQAKDLVLIPVHAKTMQVYDMVIAYSKNTYLSQSAKNFLSAAKEILTDKTNI